MSVKKDVQTLHQFPIPHSVVTSAVSTGNAETEVVPANIAARRRAQVANFILCFDDIMLMG